MTNKICDYCYKVKELNEIELTVALDDDSVICKSCMAKAEKQ